MSAAKGQAVTATNEIDALLSLYAGRFEDVALVLDDLPSEALVWRPFAHSPWQGESGELGRIIAHALSSTYWLIRVAEFAAGRCEWDAVQGDEGEEEFGPANLGIAHLRERNARARAFVFATLPTFDAAALDAVRDDPRRPGRTLNARRMIVHALEHLAEHVGHAHLTRQLWALHEASSAESA